MTVARELRKAMAARAITSKHLAVVLGVAPTTISGWRNGVIPRLTASARLADSLDWPGIADAVREARTSPCPVCGRLAVHGSGVGRYCSRRCQNTANNRNRRAVAGKPGVLAQARLKVFEGAIDELCRRWCEPAGLCRDASCPIQSAGLSPLPLAKAWERVA